VVQHRDHVGEAIRLDPVPPARDNTGDPAHLG
jgi:hypothetical protein